MIESKKWTIFFNLVSYNYPRIRNVSQPYIFLAVSLTIETRWDVVGPTWSSSNVVNLLLSHLLRTQYKIMKSSTQPFVRPHNPLGGRTTFKIKKLCTQSFVKPIVSHIVPNKGAKQSIHYGVLCHARCNQPFVNLLVFHTVPIMQKISFSMYSANSW